MDLSGMGTNRYLHLPHKQIAIELHWVGVLLYHSIAQQLYKLLLLLCSLLSMDLEALCLLLAFTDI